ncbi:CsbA family protein [Metabacillus sp. 84]|uniref:CsbA family protein n=1 Tax=Metabacillus sp. 84 TaxID=3404705 RepID=UPI003CF04AFD
MLTKAILALIFPFVLVVLFTRVTYSYIVGTLLTAALIIASYLKGYTQFDYIVGLDAVSLVAGAMYARKMTRKPNHLNK